MRLPLRAAWLSRTTAHRVLTQVSNFCSPAKIKIPCPTLEGRVQRVWAEPRGSFLEQTPRGTATQMHWQPHLEKHFPLTQRSSQLGDHRLGRGWPRGRLSSEARQVAAQRASRSGRSLPAAKARALRAASLILFPAEEGTGPETRFYLLLNAAGNNSYF